MDYTETYQELFSLLKNHKYDKFKSILNEIDDDMLFDINVRDLQGSYYLTYAVTLNQPSIVKLLVDKGAKIDIVDKYDRSILIIPILYSYDEVLEILLDANKNNIGISIVDIKDRNYRTPLHFAIEMQNMKATEMLLANGGNCNLSDKDGLNSLHIAVRSRSLLMCELIIKYVADINARYNTGETSLHIACNLQLIDIARLLIKHKININAQDYTHEITALHYAVLLNNKELIALLIKNECDPNIQDVYGNTALHYSVIENNFEIFMMLTQSIYTKHIINMNMWNIDSEIPLHIILKNNIENISDYIDILIEKSNLSLQDNVGNTCLYYLISINKWKHYKNYLVKKRLDIFTRNIDGNMPLDIINKNEYDEFIDVLIESYLYRLKSAKQLWYLEWENICGKNFADLTEEEKNMLKKEKSEIGDSNINDGNMQHVCKNIIKDKLIDLINKVKFKKEIKCYEKSFPVKRSFVCININEGEPLNYCTFTGSTMDTLIGLIYLLKKHKFTCSTLSKNFSANKELCAFYKSIGILMNTKCEFLNFEIVWVYQRLYLMDGFYDNFKKCISKNAKFIIVPIGIEMREGSHAGYMIYDVEKKEVERFEPHGSTTPPGLYYNPNLLDEILETRFKNIDENIKYIRPKDYLPKVGFQLMDIGEDRRKKIGDPSGFCALWCIWYVDMRLLYKDLDRKTLVKLLLKSVRENNVSFKNMIRNYGKHIISIRDEIFKKANMDINDWINDQYTDIQINSVMTSLNEQVETIVK